MKKGSIFGVLILLTILSLCTFSSADPPPSGFTCDSWCQGIYDLCMNNDQAKADGADGVHNCLKAKQHCLDNCE